MRNQVESISPFRFVLDSIVVLEKIKGMKKTK